MSDYGFVTFNQDNNIEKINSKWPIFGPSYNDIRNQFRNTLITCTSTHNYMPDQYNRPAPTTSFGDWWYGAVGVSTYEKNVSPIAVYKHGLGFRPICYYTVTGDFVLRTDAKVTQTMLSGGSTYGGNFTRYYTRSFADKLAPYRNTMSIASPTANPLWSRNLVPIATDSTGSPSTALLLPDNAPRFVMDYYVTAYGLPVNTGSQGYEPFRVIVDEENVYIYKYYWWSEYMFSGIRSGYDLTQRFKAVESYTGSNINITVQIIPYRMEDFR